MKTKERINFVVTDLDDTIWDWLSMWYNSFSPYFDRISNEFQIDERDLKADFKALHQKYGTSEASFIYNELSSIPQDQKNKFESESEGTKSIIHEYYSNKKASLALYDGVYTTLKQIKERGSLLVGFTESNAFFTKYRIKHLKLDGLFDFIYTPIDFDVPQSVYRHYSEDYWEPELTEFRYLPKETRKPAPEILEIILKDLKANKDHSIYIGDKLDKDVHMANKTSVRSVYAKYGHKLESDQYELLKAVTHWTNEDVQREIEFKKSHEEEAIANFTLNKSFNELNNWFSFFGFPQKGKQKPSLDNIISIWKEIVGVQQHFNDIALRIRNIAITVFTFIIGGVGYAEKEDLLFKIGSFNLPYSTIIAFFGIIIMIAFFYMDRQWYHKLLKGAVKQGAELENKWSKILPEIKLSTAIGKSSPHAWFGVYKKGERKGQRKKIHSNEKFYIFYGILTIPLFLIAILILLLNNLS